MRLIPILLAVFLCPTATPADVVDERLREGLEVEVADKEHADARPAGKMDEDKFDEAAERRQKRREDALAQRRMNNTGKNHVYSLTKMFTPPGPVGFDLARDINRGGVITGGFGNSPNLLAIHSVDRTFVLPNQTKVLFLQDGTSSLLDAQPKHLVANGLAVLTPELPLHDPQSSIAVAEFVMEQYQPDIIVGHARGGAAAMNMDSGNTPALLLCPAWKEWGNARTVKTDAVILHSRNDSVVPFAASQQLRVNSNLPPDSLIEVGNDHRLDDPESLQAMLALCVKLTSN